MYQFQIREVTKECFSALGRIRELGTGSAPNPDALYQKLRQTIDTMKTNAERAGMPREDVYDITYAMVAHADEIALNSSETIRNYWMQQPLQLHYFHETAAGEGFFTRLETIRKDPRRVEVLRVYYLCLLFGFQGSHRIRGGELALLNLTDELRYQIARTEATPEMLSPHWQRPEEATAGGRRRFPFVLAGFGTLLVAIIAFFVFRTVLTNNMESLDGKVESLMLPSSAKAPAAPASAPEKEQPGSEFGGGIRE